MKSPTHFLLGLVAVIMFTTCMAFAHPGSGIVVDEHGHVFFQDSVARTIWRIHPDGKVSAYTDKWGGHWLALDARNRFARAALKLVERIPPTNDAPTLIVADGGAPITTTGLIRLTAVDYWRHLATACSVESNAAACRVRVRRDASSNAGLVAPIASEMTIGR